MYVLQKSDRVVIADPDLRLIGGWATVEVKDKHGEIVPVDEVLRAFYKLAGTSGIPLLYEHSNKPIGQVIRWEKRVHEPTGKPGIWIEAIIYKGHPLGDRVWRLVKAGYIRGFSIAGSATRVKTSGEDGEEVVVARDVELYEVSLVADPANPEAKIEYINTLAKSAKNGVATMPDEVSKADCPRGRYTDGRHWKKMTCPGDTSGRKRPICGCIRYFMNCYYEGDLVRAVKKCLQLFSGDEEGNPEVKEETSKSAAQQVEADAALQVEGDVEDQFEVHGGELEKADSCKEKYFVCQKKEDGKCVRGHFKRMKCPDGYGPNRFCGCVNYFTDCRGESLETAKKICYKICVDKYGEEYCSGRHGKYVKKSASDNHTNTAPAAGDGGVGIVKEENGNAGTAGEEAPREEEKEPAPDRSELLRMLDEMRASIARLTETVSELSQRLSAVEKSALEKTSNETSGAWGGADLEKHILAVLEGNASPVEIANMTRSVAVTPPPTIASLPAPAGRAENSTEAIMAVLEGKKRALDILLGR